MPGLTNGVAARSVIFSTPRNGRSIRGSPIRNTSPRWVGQAAASPRCSRSRCARIFSLAAWTGLDQPSYWSNILTRWRRRGGDFDHNEKLNREVSPLYHVDQIRAPLLIGQGKNDPRVTIDNADAMVQALRAAKREVVYVVYPDEGHGFARPENQIDFYGRVEEFLAKHLGGRAEPWKKIDGSTAEVR